MYGSCVCIGTGVYQVVRIQKVLLLGLNGCDVEEAGIAVPTVALRPIGRLLVLWGVSRPGFATTTASASLALRNDGHSRKYERRAKRMLPERAQIEKC